MKYELNKKNQGLGDKKIVIPHLRRLMSKFGDQIYSIKLTRPVVDYLLREILFKGKDQIA